MNVFATNSQLVKHEVYDELSTPGPLKGGAARRGPMRTLLVVSAILIAVVAWVLFSNLFFFTHRSATSPPRDAAPAAPISIPKKPDEPLFVPTDTSSQPVINPPFIAGDKDSDAIEHEPDPDPVAEDRPEKIAPPADAVTEKSGRARSTTSTPRRVPPQPGGVSPRAEKRVVTKSEPVPRARTPTLKQTPETDAAPATISGNGNNMDQPSNVESTVGLLSGDLVDGPGITDARSTERPPDSGGVRRDPASDIANAPLPDPPAKKMTRRNYGLVVIVNRANTEPLSLSDISNIYRDRVTRWPSGERILALNLPLDSGEHQRFSAAILKMSALDAAKEHANRAITNRTQNEYRTKNAQAVVSYVERHENAIGYVPEAALNENDNVRVLFAVP